MPSISKIYGLDSVIQLVNVFNHAPNVPVANYPQYVEVINAMVHNINKKDIHFNGIYRSHLMQLLQEIFDMFTSGRITPGFARDISAALLVTNLTAYEDLLEIKTEQLSPLQQLVTLSVDVFLQMYQEAEYVQHLDYKEIENQMMATYQYQCTMKELQESNITKFNDLEKTQVILWTEYELYEIRNMIIKSGRYHGIRKSILIQRMFTALDGSLRNIWKEISELRIKWVPSLATDDHNMENNTTYHLSQDAKYLEDVHAQKIKFRSNVCIGVLKDLIRTKTGPDLMIRNSITIHLLKILWQLVPFRKYAVFAAADALFDDQTLSLVINIFRCNRFRDLAYLSEILTALMETRQDWNFVDAIQLSSQFQLFSAEEKLKTKFNQITVG